MEKFTKAFPSKPFAHRSARPWAMAGALIDLRDVRPRERRVWQWLAVSFATLLSIEAVRAIATKVKAGQLDASRSRRQSARLHGRGVRR